jgi:hypothetical protein
MPRANSVVYEDSLPLEERLFFSSSSYSPCIIGLGYLASNPHTTPHNNISFKLIKYISSLCFSRALIFLIKLSCKLAIIIYILYIVLEI